MIKKLVATYNASFIVKNQKGLHTRPCAEIVRCAARFKSEIWLTCGSRKVEAKSLLGLLTLAAAKGSFIKVTAEGVDSEAAVNAILDLATRAFDNEY